MSFKNFKILTIMVLAAFVWTFAAASICQAEKDWLAGKTSPAFKTGEEAVAWLEKQGI